MIEGQVAAIINSRELAINRGSDDGVQEGMKFEVLELKGVNITDPETGKKLGSVSLVKIRVRAALVERKFTIAETYETLGGTPNLSSLFLKMEPMRYRTLKTDEAINAAPLTEEESYVKRGDPVRQISEDSAQIADKAG